MNATHSEESIDVDDRTRRALKAVVDEDPAIRRVIRDERTGGDEASALDIKSAVYRADVVLVADQAQQTTVVRRHPESTAFWRVVVDDETGEVEKSTNDYHAGVQGFVDAHRTSLRPLDDVDVFDDLRRPVPTGGDR